MNFLSIHRRRLTAPLKAAGHRRGEGRMRGLTWHFLVSGSAGLPRHAG
jgi:hypothetical protein